jgi:hypothetical protein
MTLSLTAFAVFLLLLAKLLVATTLGLGPIFVAFLLFDATLQCFRNWIASLVTLVVFQLIVYATLGLGYGIYQAVVPEGELYTADSLDPTQLQGRVLPLLVIFTSLLFVLRKADGHAHSLIGSMSYIGDARATWSDPPNSARCGGSPRAPHSNGIEQGSGRPASGENAGRTSAGLPRERDGNEMENVVSEMPRPTLLPIPGKEWEYLTHGAIVVERNDGFWHDHRRTDRSPPQQSRCCLSRNWCLSL